MTMTANGLAKLVEECGELTQIAAKKMAYMGTDHHPDGHGSMRQRLEAEMGDVMGAIRFVVQTLDLDAAVIEQRADYKLAVFEAWHADPQA